MLEVAGVIEHTTGTPTGQEKALQADDATGRDAVTVKATSRGGGERRVGSGGDGNGGGGGDDTVSNDDFFSVAATAGAHHARV